MRLGCFRRLSHEISRSAYWVKAASTVIPTSSGILQDHFSCLTEHEQEGKKIYDMLLGKAT